LIHGNGIKAPEAIQIMKIETAGNISEERLRTFLDGKYGWKGLPPADQLKMARELDRHRAFLRVLKGKIGE